MKINPKKEALSTVFVFFCKIIGTIHL